MAPDDRLRAEVAALVIGTTALYRMGRPINAELDRQFGLDMRHYSILRLIAAGVFHPSVIAAEIDLRRTLMSRAIDTLVAADFVRRTLDEHDTRRTRLSLTDKGRQTLEAATETIVSVIAPSLRRLSAVQRSQFFETLSLLVENTPE